MANLLRETIKSDTIEAFAEKIEWLQVVHTRWDFDGDNDTCNKFQIPPTHTLEEAVEVLKQLDFTYDDGYGTQEVEGTIMFKDGTWMERREYDGAEWWVRVKAPTWCPI